MSDSMVALRRQIDSAGELRSVVRTMRALAASSIGQYERAIAALADYDRAVGLGLGVCLRSQLGSAQESSVALLDPKRPAFAVVFGSDQGLVGQFNDAVVDRAVAVLATVSHRPLVWVVGERSAVRLAEAGLTIAGVLPVPSAADAIDLLVGRLQVDIETHPAQSAQCALLVFHNRPLPGALYEPDQRRLLPLDSAWLATMAGTPWPTQAPPEILGDHVVTLRAFLREFLFISLYRACAESLASENASRLAAMQRADKSIEELLGALNAKFNRLRQGAIDAELFDVVSGYQSSAAAPGAR